MVETKTILCDVCKEKVGKYKCNLCNVDLCSTCVTKICLDIRGIYSDSSGSFGNKDIAFCEKCHKKLVENNPNNKKLLDKEILNKLSNEIMKYVKKKLIINNLK